jgi:hypothetical protein
MYMYKHAHTHINMYIYIFTGQQTAVLGAFQTVLGFLADTKFDSTELNFVGENNTTKGTYI